MPISAEVITLRSGQQFTGQILMQNEQVVVFRDVSGSRYQYMMEDVLSIQADEERQVEEEPQPTEAKERKVAVALQVSGGGSLIPAPEADLLTGGMMSGELAIGACNVLDRHIFLGGTIGGQVVWLDGQKVFVPIRLRAELPLTQTTHAPLVGVGVGYGIAANKQYKGGLSAVLDMGWRYLLPRKGAFYLGLTASFQQAKLSLTETVNEMSYTSFTARSIVGFGVKTALYF